MNRFAAIISFAALAGLVGCATKQLSPSEVAKLRGGTTKVVVYGFCVPMDHLIKTAMTRYTLTYVVNGKTIGTMKSCSYGTFNVPSGYWESKFDPGLLSPSHRLPYMKFRPGATQYLHMRPSGNGTFSGSWVSKAHADKGIAEIRKIGQMI